MGIFKRGNVWWYRFTTPNGKPVKESAKTGNENEAQRIHDEKKAESWRVDMLGEKPVYTWADAAAKWLLEKENEEKSTYQDGLKIEWLTTKFGENTPLTKLSKDVIRTAIEGKKKLNRKGQVIGPIAKATKNRYYALVSAILAKAVEEWEWIDRKPKLKKHKEDSAEVAYLKPEEVERLLAELPEHLRNVVAFSLATGFRMRNTTHLLWSQVDMEQRKLIIPGRFKKNGEPQSIPLCDTAYAILKAQEGKHTERVFTYCGPWGKSKPKPFDNANTKSFRKALERAEITLTRFHTITRHTWASWLIQAGVSTRELKELGGWLDWKMVERYAHLDTDHLIPAASVVDKFLRATNSGTMGAQQEERKAA